MNQERLIVPAAVVLRRALDPVLLVAPGDLAGVALALDALVLKLLRDVAKLILEISMCFEMCDIFYYSTDLSANLDRASDPDLADAPPAVLSEWAAVDVDAVVGVALQLALLVQPVAGLVRGAGGVVLARFSGYEEIFDGESPDASSESSPWQAASVVALVALRAREGRAGLRHAHLVQAGLPLLALLRALHGLAGLGVVLALLAQGAVADGRAAVLVLGPARALGEALAVLAFLQIMGQIG